MDDAVKAERLLRNLARRLKLEAPGVSKSILEGLDEILTVTRLGLPKDLRRSLASTNIIESMNAVIPAGLPQREALARRKDGPALDEPPDCWKQPRASAASRPTSRCPSSRSHSRSIAIPSPALGFTRSLGWGTVS